jgi:hypothetical protein
MVGALAVDHVGSGATHRAAEDPRERVDCQRIGLLRFQCSRGGDE